MAKNPHNLSKSEAVANIPAACSDELVAIEFFEEQRWGDTPCCVKCGSVEVCKMTDAKTGERNKRFLWRCTDCKEQYTVRIGSVYEESRLPIRHWAYAFWCASTSKKGVSALEITRHCQISYKSALFLMNRIRFAMAPDLPSAPPLAGIIEVDETYVGGRPRVKGSGKHGRGTKKTPVVAAVQRNGEIRRHVVADVTADTLKAAIREVAHPSARIASDENHAFHGPAKEFAGGHETVTHSTKKYARGDVQTNTAEISSALVKRGIIGVYHNVAKNIVTGTFGSSTSFGTPES